MKRALFKIERLCGLGLGYAVRPFQPLAVVAYRFLIWMSHSSERVSILTNPFLMEFGYAAFDGKPERWVTKHIVQGIKIRLDISEKTQRNIYFAKVYERDLTRFMLSRLRGQDTFIDVGANVGYFTVLAGGLVGPGRVIACEPEEKNYISLRENVSLNAYSNTTTLRTAVGGVDGVTTLHINPLNRGGNSVLPFEAYHTGEHYFSKEYIQQRYGALSQTVPLISIDTLVRTHHITDIALIKIDVEGFELSVIEGMKETLQNGITKYILCELANKDSRTKIISLLTQAGYEACALTPNGEIARSQCLGRDVLFVRVE